MVENHALSQKMLGTQTKFAGTKIFFAPLENFLNMDERKYISNPRMTKMVGLQLSVHHWKISHWTK